MRAEQASPSDGEPKLKSRTEVASGYPKRELPTERIDGWSNEYSDYKPAQYTSDKVIEQSGRTADPEDIASVIGDGFQGSQYKAVHNSQGYPLNPFGPTGIEGRGLLYKWGVNFTADPIVTRNNPESGQLEMVAIKRAGESGTGQWAIPGGFVEAGDSVSATLAKEFKEEGLQGNDEKEIDSVGERVLELLQEAPIVYRGFVDDPRTTDNAWIETTAAHLHLSEDLASKLKLEAGDDADSIQWMALTTENVGALYASHKELVKLALEQLSS